MAVMADKTLAPHGWLNLALTSAMATLLLSATSSAAIAADVELTFTQAVQQAISWHPQLREAETRRRQGEQGVSEARAGYLPQLSAGMNSRYSRPDDNEFRSRHAQRWQLQGSQLLYDFGGVSSRVANARAIENTLAAQAGVTEEKVILDAADSWLEVRRFHALEQVSQHLAERVTELESLVQRRQRSGASSQSDSAQAAARVADAEESLLDDQTQNSRWRFNLLYVTGSSQPPLAVGALPSFDAVGCARVAAANDFLVFDDTPALQVAKSRLQQSRTAWKEARANRLPTLSLNASHERAMNHRSQRVVGADRETQLRLEANMPLYQGGALRARQLSALYAEQAAAADLDNVRRERDQQLQEALVQWLQIGQRETLQQRRISSMEATRRLYEQQYFQLGTRTLLDLLNAEQEYHRAQRDLIDSRYDRLRLDLQCAFYSGGLLSYVNQPVALP